MELTVGVGLVLTAGVLGITHGIEPDHVAGVTALTHKAGDARLSALVGGCFAVGHALLVVAWIAGAYLLFGTTSFPGYLETVGMTVVGTLLALLSLYLGVSGTRKLLHRHEHDHSDDGEHAHFHLHLPFDVRSDRKHGHKHTVFEYLKIGVVGALFTLSPPLSMIAFISVTMSESAGILLVGAVAAYTITIVATMAAIGGGAGALFDLTKARGERVHAASQVVASVLVLAFAVNILAAQVPVLLQ